MLHSSLIILVASNIPSGCTSSISWSALSQHSELDQIILVSALSASVCTLHCGYGQCVPNALSTLSQKSSTVAENGETTAKFVCDSLTFLRQIVALFCDSVDRA